MNEKPKEISSKIQVCKSRPAVKVKNRTKRDPRFDERCGKFSKTIYDQKYRFITDLKNNEIQVTIFYTFKTVKKNIKTENNSEKKQNLKNLHHSLNQQKLRNKEHNERYKNMEFLQQKQREISNQTGNPYFLKKDYLKKLQLVNKFKELKKSGKLKSYMDLVLAYNTNCLIKDSTTTNFQS
ncbi:hypothetical protein HZS_6355, partial [Henneguya salminicola]